MIKNNKYYSIVKTGIDEYKLTIKVTGKEIDFKRDVNFITEMQKANVKGRLRLIEYLKENEVTKDDLIIRKETVDKDNKVVVIYDDSQYRELEQDCVKEATAIILSNLTKQILNEDLMTVLLEMEIPQEEQKEVSKQFTKDFMNCMLNRTSEDTPRTIARKKAK